MISKLSDFPHYLKPDYLRNLGKEGKELYVRFLKFSSYHFHIKSLKLPMSLYFLKMRGGVSSVVFLHPPLISMRCVFNRPANENSLN